MSIILPDDKAKGDTEPVSGVPKPGGPSNDEGLCAAEILGRCSVCSTVGHIDYSGRLIPSKDLDRIIAYKPVACFCPNCKKTTEFLPIEVKKYPDVPYLGSLQDGFRKGLIR